MVMEAKRIVERAQMLFKLKEFYLLEIYQVDFYRDQVPSFDEERARMAYTHMAVVEQGHVDYFAGKLRELGAEPPALAGDLAGLAGRLTAKAMDLTIVENRHRLGIFYETEAARMYLEFIEMARGDDEGLFKTLWNYRTDEEFHRFWLAAELETMKENPPVPAGV